MNRNHTDKGASALIVASSMFFLFGVAALAIDLAALRFDHRADRLATDAAATAGAASINPFAGSEADDGCQVAWDYLLLNLDDTGGTISPPDCSVFAGDCPATARQTTASAGSFNFVITHPVPDTDALMGGQAINDDVDGAPCQRLAVTARRTRNHTFARALGFEQATTEVRSVARIAPGVGAGEVVPLLILEPTSCNALYVSGQGGVTVSYFEDSPGFIVVDSDGSGGTGSNSCTTGSRFTIEPGTNQLAFIRALPTPEGIPSAILSYALAGKGSAQPSKSYNPADVETNRLSPRPQAISRRITRAPIDWRYNCKGSYPEYPLTLSMSGGVPIDPCPNAPAPHIDTLVTNNGGSGSPMGIFQRWSDNHPCNVATDLEVAGDWWIDCSPRFVVNGAQMTFTNSSRLVFDGDIDLRSTGRLRINQGEASDQVVYVRNGGDLIMGAQAQIIMERTFVYLAGGTMSLGGGNLPLIWTAPLGGNFEDLALWAEAHDQFEIGGQASNELTGTFFTPMSDPFTLTGQAGQFQTDAQFLTRRLEVKSQAEVLMHPDPTRQTLIPIREVRLIR